MKLYLVARGPTYKKIPERVSAVLDVAQLWIQGVVEHCELIFLEDDLQAFRLSVDERDPNGVFERVRGGRYAVYKWYELRATPSAIDKTMEFAKNVTSKKLTMDDNTMRACSFPTAFRSTLVRLLCEPDDWTAAGGTRPDGIFCSALLCLALQAGEIAPPTLRPLQVSTGDLLYSLRRPPFDVARRVANPLIKNTYPPPL